MGTVLLHMPTKPHRIWARGSRPCNYSAKLLLMTDSLKTSRLGLAPMLQIKMERFAGNLGVDVADEVGAPAGDLLHVDARRKTYGHALRRRPHTVADRPRHL